MWKKGEKVNNETRLRTYPVGSNITSGVKSEGLLQMDVICAVVVVTQQLTILQYVEPDDEPGNRVSVHHSRRGFRTQVRGGLRGVRGSRKIY
jgi:hypothetical protein